MDANELLKQKNGVLFYEEDLPAPALYQKVETVEDDVVVRSFDRDFEQSRLGLREMDPVERNSKSYHVFSKDELVQLNEFFTLAYLED